MLVAAIAGGGSAAEPCAAVLARIAQTSIRHAQRVADVPGLLAVLATGVAAGGVVAQNCVGALGSIAEAHPGLAQCVAETPGLLAVLASTVPDTR